MYFFNPSMTDKTGCLIWVSSVKNLVFLIKTVLSWGILAISFWKKSVLNWGLCWLEPCYPGTPCISNRSPFFKCKELDSSTSKDVNFLFPSFFLLWDKNHDQKHQFLSGSIIMLIFAKFIQKFVTLWHQMTYKINQAIQ